MITSASVIAAIHLRRDPHLPQRRTSTQARSVSSLLLRPIPKGAEPVCQWFQAARYFRAGIVMMGVRLGIIQK